MSNGNWLYHYLTAQYVDGARGPYSYDCFGLAREVRHKFYGKRLLPSFGELRNTQPKEFTRAYAAEAATMEVCAPEAGAIAAVFRGMLCIHVAVVIELEGQLSVLEINPRSGPRRLTVPEFERHYLKVLYYRDCHLPE